MPSPNISIIIPVYNASKTLDACIASILRQTYCDYEVVLIDDGSSDSSADLCDSIATQHEHFKVAHIPHSGSSAARNKGLEMATGKFISFIDSDDEVDGRYLETLLYIISDYDADVAALSYQIIPRRKKPKPINDSAPIKIFPCEEAVLTLLYQNNLDSSQCFKLFRRDIINNIRFPEQYRVYEDLWFIYQIYSRCNKVAWTNRKLYFYHKERYGQMDKTCPLVDDSLNIVEDISKDLRLRFPHERFEKAINSRTVSISFNLLKHLSRQHISNPELENRCWENIKSLRLGNLLDPNARFNNKLGVLLSFFGKSFFKFLASTSLF